MGTKTQEIEAHCTTTSSFLNQVAETQEPATHPVAETQEPVANPVAETQEPTTHSVVETQEPTIVVTQEPTIAETQEPIVDIVTKMQESDTQGAATLLSLHEEAETQESMPIACLYCLYGAFLNVRLQDY
jgi:hypothetical protein